MWKLNKSNWFIGNRVFFAFLILLTLVTVYDYFTDEYFDLGRLLYAYVYLLVYGIFFLYYFLILVYSYGYVKLLTFLTKKISNLVLCATISLIILVFLGWVIYYPLCYGFSTPEKWLPRDKHDWKVVAQLIYAGIVLSGLVFCYGSYTTEGDAQD